MKETARNYIYIGIQLMVERLDHYLTGLWNLESS